MNTKNKTVGTRCAELPASRRFGETNGARESRASRATFSSLALCLLLSCFLLHPSSLLHAFPPAPHHTVFGQVRDEFGNPLTISGAKVYLVTGSGAAVEGDLRFGLEPGINYSLDVPMDSGIAADLYRPTALKPTLPFTLRVKVGSTVYLPIEMKGDYKSMGEPGKRTRIDLTLGEDSDNDGLPDAWERALIAALGGGFGLGDIDGNGDNDGDGLSNLNEYLAGSYAFDPENGFKLDIVRLNNGAPVLRFIALQGRSYSVLASADLKNWAPVRFKVSGGDETLHSDYESPDVRALEIEAEPAGGDRPQFFKLVVR